MISPDVINFIENEISIRCGTNDPERETVNKNLSVLTVPEEWLSYLKLTWKYFQKLDLRGVFVFGKENFSYFDMFDLENWYNNLSDDAFSKYESTKEEVKAVLVGTGEKGDTCFGKVAGFYKDLFGQSLDQVYRI